MLARNAGAWIPQEWAELGAAAAREKVLDLQRQALDRRHALLKACDRSASAKEAEIQKCAEDPVYFLANWGWISNANLGTKFPFLPFEAQVRKIIHPLYLALRRPLAGTEDHRNFIIKKPRAVGATFTALEAGFLWPALFHQAWDDGPFVGLLGANKKETLDKSDNPETHFGRMRMVLNQMPGWMLPKAKGEDEGGYKTIFLQIRFPANNSIILGKAVDENFGRGERSTIAAIDEEAFVPNNGASRALVSLRDNTNRVLRISTVNGHDASFYRTWVDGGDTINRIEMHWSDCPWHDKAWLEEQRRQRADNPVAFAQEIMADFMASAGGKCWDEFDRTRQVVPVEPNDREPIYCLLDIGYTDGCAITWIQPDFKAGTHNVLGYTFRKEAKLWYFIPFLLGHFPKKDLYGQPFFDNPVWGPAERAFVARIGAAMAKAPATLYFGGSDIRQERMHEEGFVRIMRDQWNIPVRAVRLNNKQATIRKVGLAIKHFRIDAEIAHLRLAGMKHDICDVIEQYRWQDKNPGDDDAYMRPVHNDYSNGADDLQYYAEVQKALIPHQAEDEQRRSVYFPDARMRRAQHHMKQLQKDVFRRYGA